MSHRQKIVDWYSNGLSSPHILSIVCPFVKRTLIFLSNRTPIQYSEFNRIKWLHETNQQMGNVLCHLLRMGRYVSSQTQLVPETQFLPLDLSFSIFIFISVIIFNLSISLHLSIRCPAIPSAEIMENIYSAEELLLSPQNRKFNHR